MTTIILTKRALIATLLVGVFTAFGLLAGLSKAVPDFDGRSALDAEEYDSCIEEGKNGERETAISWVCRMPRRIFVEYPSIALDGHIRTTSYDRLNRIQRTLTGYP